MRVYRTNPTKYGIPISLWIDRNMHKMLNPTQENFYVIYLGEVINIHRIKVAQCILPTGQIAWINMSQLHEVALRVIQGV